MKGERCANVPRGRRQGGVTSRRERRKAAAAGAGEGLEGRGEKKRDSVERRR